MSESEAQKTKIQTETHRSNIPEFSVSDLALSLKRTLEENYGRIRVRGELSRISIAGSGHLYSSLKDDQAVIDAVCWKGVLSNLSVKPEEGLEVICTGRISSYPKSSKYQLIIESMELAGEGALLKMLEERKKKLGEEGLFAPERKNRCPSCPRPSASSPHPPAQSFAIFSTAWPIASRAMCWSGPSSCRATARLIKSPAPSAASKPFINTASPAPTCSSSRAAAALSKI